MLNVSLGIVVRFCKSLKMQENCFQTYEHALCRGQEDLEWKLHSRIKAIWAYFFKRMGNFSGNYGAVMGNSRVGRGMKFTIKKETLRKNRGQFCLGISAAQSCMTPFDLIVLCFPCFALCMIHVWYVVFVLVHMFI